MDLQLEEEDFDSELLIWDNDEDDKETSIEQCNDDNPDNKNGNIGHNLRSDSQLKNENPDSNTSQPTDTIFTTPTLRSSHPGQGMTTNLFLTPQQDSINQPFLNTFISAMADKSSSHGQSAPSNVLNASTGLPIIFTSTSNMTNQAENQAFNTLAPYQAAEPQSIQSYQMEPIFPPNFFLNGLPSWNPSQVTTSGMNPTQLMNQENKNNIQNEIKKYDQSNDAQIGRDEASRAILPTQYQPQNEHLLQQSDNEWNHVQVSKHIAMLQANQARIQGHKESNKNHSNEASLSSHHDDSSTNTGLVQPIVPGQASGVAQFPGKANAISDNDSSSQSQYGKSASLPQRPLHANIQFDNSVASKGKSNTIPPFYLFDAPIELRHNFIQAQKAMNLPPLKDSNSFHYMMASKDLKQSDKTYDKMISSSPSPFCPTQLGSLTSPDGKKVELKDARQKKSEKGNLRNEREQQRAQKITELIDKLRTTMVQDGWKVEMKSKYQTLSTCAEYVKHLIAVTKEKEEKLAKTKADLSIRDQKLKEEKSLQDSRSDPESVTSSLTAFSTSSANVQATLSSDNDKSTKKERDAPQSTSEASSDPSPKKQYVDDRSGASRESGPNGKDISVKKMSSSFSDMTDSNKGSSDFKRTSTRSENESKTAVVASEVCSQKSSDMDVSSTAAVMSGISSQEHCNAHADIVIKMGSRDRKRKHHDEKNSLDENFSLNYEEVFLHSNVPQIIVTMEGRIVVCNDFFHRLTGLSQQDVKRITIFSLVQTDRLSCLYELIAESIRNSSNHTDIDSGVPSLCSSGNATATSDSSSPEKKYSTISLPCIEFPRNLQLLNDKNQQHSIFMHVTYIWDKIPSKRCLHCAFSDISGSNGLISCVSPSLFYALSDGSGY